MPNLKTKNILGCFSILIILGLIIGGAGKLISNGCHSNNKPPVEEKQAEVVVNSEWDGSVSQVEDYLKRHLNDWHSYESVEWSKVVKTEQLNHAFMVRHTYRAVNGFGSKMLVNQIFYLDYQGKVVEVEDLK